MSSSGTPDFNRRGIMKKSILIVLASIFLSYPMNLIGGDFDTPHTFSAGDTISADMMNEIFDYIKNANKMISASELIGTWSCLRYTMSNECKTPALGTWTVGTDSLYRYNSGTLVMSYDNDSTYSYTTSIPNIFSCEANESVGLGNWVLKNNILFITFSTNGTAGALDETGMKLISLKKVSSSKLLMQYGAESKIVFAECDKQNLPPTTPATLTASASGTTVSLAWSDNSTNERNFNVLRRDSCDGSFSMVDNVTANETSSTDTVPAAGSYWYRVSATNDNGTSVPSKMVRVDVE